MATTYYVRSDGGCPCSPGSGNCSGGGNPGCASICNGTTDAAYSAGVTPNCAFNHPHWVIPNRGQGTTAYNMQSGDTVVVHGPEAGTGEYRMGCQAGGTCRDVSVNISLSGECDSTYSFDCGGNQVPDGTPTNHSRIIGCSTSGCNGGTRPILWSAGRTNRMFYLSSSDYVDLTDLELTDHAAGTYAVDSSCNSGGSSLAGLDAILAYSGSNIKFENLYIHGFCRYGLLMGGLTNFTMNHSVIDKNGWSGWSVDSCAGAGTCGLAGNIVLYKDQITYSGCAEDYPSLGLLTHGCHAQADSVIADGIESADTGGLWTVSQSNISHNTHDGLDLLYLNKGSYSGGSVVVKDSLFEGNGGNPVKVANAATIKNNFILSNCGYFTGQTFASATWDNVSDSCRAFGNAIEIAFRDATTQPSIYSNTIYSNGDVVVDTTGSCTAGTNVNFVNNIVYGGRQHNDDTTWNGAGANDITSIFYNASGGCSATFNNSYSVCYGTKEGASSCTGTNSVTTNPNVVGGAIASGPVTYYSGSNMIADMYLTASSSNAINSATTSYGDSTDYNNYSRGASWDMGAVEYGSVQTCSALGDYCSLNTDCCSGFCNALNTCAIPGSYLYNITPIGSIKFQ